jgi:hypothetical protein
MKNATAKPVQNVTKLQLRLVRPWLCESQSKWRHTIYTTSVSLHTQSFSNSSGLIPKGVLFESRQVHQQPKSKLWFSSFFHHQRVATVSQCRPAAYPFSFLPTHCPLTVSPPDTQSDRLTASLTGLWICKRSLPSYASFSNCYSKQPYTSMKTFCNTVQPNGGHLFFLSVPLVLPCLSLLTMTQNVIQATQQSAQPSFCSGTEHY